MDVAFFNIDFGYLEAVVRGFKSTILLKSDYVNLSQSISLEDVKLNLQASDYGSLFSSMPSPITVPMIEEKIKEKLVKEFFYLKNNSIEPLTSFLGFITYGYMIDNIALLISGTVHNRPVSELISRCHPLGIFDNIETIGVISSPSELFNAILIDTPLATFFSECVSEQDFDEMHVEIIRSQVYKYYLEAFYRFCKSLGGTTFEVMRPILEFEADRRAFSITINSLGTDINKEQRSRFYPTCGILHPDGLIKLAKADDFEQIKSVASLYYQYEPLFAESSPLYSGKTIEDRFFEYEARLNSQAFFYQFNFGIFYAYVKLSEQQCRNIVWICECISQDNKKKIADYIPIY